MAGVSTTVYTVAQAEAGKAAYSEVCASCHADDLSGGGDPPQLAGADFIASWKSRTTRDLFQSLQRMPPGGPTLTAEQYLAIAAYILKENGAKAGGQSLTESTLALLGSIATGERPVQP